MQCCNPLHSPKLTVNERAKKACQETALKPSAHTDVMREPASFMTQAEHGCLRS